MLQNWLRCCECTKNLFRSISIAHTNEQGGGQRGGPDAKLSRVGANCAHSENESLPRLEIKEPRMPLTSALIACLSEIPNAWSAHGSIKRENRYILGCTPLNRVFSSAAVPQVSNGEFCHPKIGAPMQSSENNIFRQALKRPTGAGTSASAKVRCVIKDVCKLSRKESELAESYSSRWLSLGIAIDIENRCEA